MEYWRVLWVLKYWIFCNKIWYSSLKIEQVMIEYLGSYKWQVTMSRLSVYFIWLTLKSVTSQHICWCQPARFYSNGINSLVQHISHLYSIAMKIVQFWHQDVHCNVINYVQIMSTNVYLSHIMKLIVIKLCPQWCQILKGKINENSLQHKIETMLEISASQCVLTWGK